jgi:shikimate kinase
MSNSIVLVGMPGSGKSTLGRLLANRTQMPFADTDLYIEGKAGCSLQEYLDEHGYLKLRELEEAVILEHEHHFQNTVISTGGSVVYSEKSMEHLKRFGAIVYLQVSPEALLERIHNMESRGIACKPGQTFHDLYHERCALYEKHADVTLNIDGESEMESLEKLLAQI